MSEVTVKAIQPVLGLDDGAVVTIERTPRVDAAIRAGALAVVGAPAAPEPEPAPAPDEVDAEVPVASAAEAPRTKRVRKLAGD